MLQSYKDANWSELSSVCIGNFDGLHLGHQKILMTCLDSAKRKALRPVMMSFEPHPAMVLNPARGLKRLLTESERRDLLLKSHFQSILLQKFDFEFSKISASDFIEEVLKKFLKAKQVVVGKNFRFGKNAEGHIDLLKSVGGLDVLEVEDFCMPGESEVLSSSKIRAWLRGGQIESVKEALAYDYFLSGTVVEGAKRGRQIQFPTANLKISPEKCSLQSGVYASLFEDRQSGKIFPSITNIGNRPTVNEDGSPLSIETHLISFSDDLYGRDVRVFFLKRIRDEKKFSDLSALQKAIAEDVKKVADDFVSLKFLRPESDRATQTLLSISAASELYSAFSGLRI